MGGVRSRPSQCPVRRLPVRGCRVRPHLAGLQKELQNQLHPEPCQTVETAAASCPEPQVKPLTASMREAETEKKALRGSSIR